MQSCRYLQVIYSLGNAPAVGLQRCLTLLQRHSVHRCLHLPIKREEAE